MVKNEDIQDENGIIEVEPENIKENVSSDDAEVECIINENNGR